jgi:hypothetical protein
MRVKLTQITCSCAGCTHPAVEAKTKGEAIARATALGWFITRKHDLCPTHWARITGVTSGPTPRTATATSSTAALA